jgi:hypothetical protein
MSTTMVDPGVPTSGITGESEATSAATGTIGTSSASGTSGGDTGDATGVSASDGMSDSSSGVGGDTTTGTSTGTGTTGDAASSGGSSDTGEPLCVELMQGFIDPPVPSGFVKCGDKLPHRVSAEACVVPATPSACNIGGSFCETNADCVEQPFGSCQMPTSMAWGCECVYGCQTDADCAPGKICRCAGEVLGDYTTCVPSTCTVDADCGGELCQFSQSDGDGCPPAASNGNCSTPNDLCDSDTPCGTSPCMAFDVPPVWQCSGIACGRPYVVDARPVVAPKAMREDWCALVAIPTASSALRDRLAAYWTEVALAEHASIASFARHILHLLAVGAPPALVCDAQRALADEVEHARLGFALASLYGGTGVGPGPLPQAGATGAEGLAAIVEAVIREACVGETLSALEAQEAASRVEDPTLRRVLQQIADDEQRHAELGWRVVQWALGHADAALRERVRDMFVTAIAEARATATTLATASGEPELRSHGVIDAPLRAAVWDRGLRELVGPSALALAAAA